eukprot:TRINITY_DN30009_c0_g1_i1.p1 TRINITY_DN30009_c0_g1~~TRINITY_DN30009_c0_g1_i1.p1  ORF type:complete len:100 (+),score=9.78 TRINITY_DN30009_c0_g1_i1:1557-1856(+)
MMTHEPQIVRILIHGYHNSSNLVVQSNIRHNQSRPQPGPEWVKPDSNSPKGIVNEQFSSKKKRVPLVPKIDTPFQVSLLISMHMEEMHFISPVNCNDNC